MIDWHDVPPTTARVFLIFPRKSSDGGWYWGRCFIYWKHYYSGSDPYYVSEAEAFILLIQGKLQRVRL